MNLNPWGLILAGLGIVLVYVGVKGSQHTLVSAVTGKADTAGKASSTSYQPPTPGHAPTTVVL